MSDFRIKYGVAYGPYGTVGVTSGGGTAPNLLPPQDATPDISRGTYWLTNNTSALSYTYFDGASNGLINPEEGHQLQILFQDGNSTLVNGAQFRLQNSANFLVPSGTVVEFVYSNSVWYQKGVVPVSQAQVVTVTSSNVAASGLVTVTPNTTVVIANAAAASNMVLRGFTGGVDGQRIVLVLANSNITLGHNSAAFVDSIVTRTLTGNTATLVGSGGWAFVRMTIGGTAAWHEVVSLAVGSV